MLEDDDAFPDPEIEHLRLQRMVEDLQDAVDTEGSVSDVSQPEARKNSSIHIVLRHVCKMFKDNQPNLVKEAKLKSRALVPTGVADFMVSRKRRKILVVEAKKEQFSQGQAQDFVMMDIALALNEEAGESSDEIYGIVSNYLMWIFYRRTKDRIVWTVDHINEKRTGPEDAKRIARRIFAMLKE
ncbi:hypothetical protein FI667_g14259, partial [Globisporangium splendens]